MLTNSLPEPDARREVYAGCQPPQSPIPVSIGSLFVGLPPLTSTAPSPPRNYGKRERVRLHHADDRRILHNRVHLCPPPSNMAATHALFPILSRILSHCYSLAATAAVSRAPRGLPTLSKADSRNSKVDDATVGLFFKLVRIATGFVPVPLAGRPLHGAKIAESIASGRTTLLRGATTLVLFSVFVCACSIAVAYPHFAMV